MVCVVFDLYSRIPRKNWIATYPTISNGKSEAIIAKRLKQLHMKFPKKEGSEKNSFVWEVIDISFSLGKNLLAYNIPKKN